MRDVTAGGNCCLFRQLPVEIIFASGCGAVHCRITVDPGWWACAKALVEESSMQNSQGLRFREAKRIQQSFLAVAEKRVLLWLAARTPARINSDHLTLLGLLAMAVAGSGHGWSRTNRPGPVVC